ncbi:MAG: type II secretion system F family protein [Patescibacteria group bacterium]
MKNIDISWGRVSLTDRALLAKQLSVMLESGLVLSEALKTAEVAAAGALKPVVAGLLRAVDSGRSLSDALAEHPRIFSGLFASAVFAGENSGTLPENLKNVSRALERERDFRSKVRGAMIYPTIVLIATFILGLALSFFVLPKITPLFEGLAVELPLTTRWLIAFSNFVQAHGLATVIGLAAGLAALSYLARARWMEPLTHRLWLRLPIVGRLEREANLARLAGTLGSLLKSGVPIDQALGIVERALGNYVYRRALARAAAMVGRGDKLSSGLMERRLFPPIFVSLIGVGEESGKFEETLQYLSEFYEAELDKTTKSLATAIEPALLLVIGLVVAVFALSIITPIYEITGNVKR